jgi:hypothetical protein
MLAFRLCLLLAAAAAFEPTAALLKRLDALEAQNAALATKVAHLEETWVPPVGQLVLFGYDRKSCPRGYMEYNVTSGYIFMGRPAGGEIGTYVNRRWTANETQRVGKHTHGVTDKGHAHGVNDPGHTHNTTDKGHAHEVTDPGHVHSVTDPGHVHGVTDPGHTHKLPVYVSLSKIEVN